MMEGITVLHEYTTGGPDIVMQIILYLFTLVSLIIALYGIVMKYYYKNNTWKLKEIITLVVIAGISFGLGVWNSTWTPHKEYKVTIDNEVSYVEFIEKYELINQEGSIYTIRMISEGEE